VCVCVCVCKCVRVFVYGVTTGSALVRGRTVEEEPVGTSPAFKSFSSNLLQRPWHLAGR